MTGRQRRPRIWALIPARSGSKRFKDKAIVKFFGYPLLAYAISACKRTVLFDRIIVNADSDEYGDIAQCFGAEFYKREPELASDDSPDIEWLYDMLSKITQPPEYFFIVRPCHPFRTAFTLLDAWNTFSQHPDAHSLRAVEDAGVNIYKMWTVGENGYLIPYKHGTKEVGKFIVPLHSYPSQYAPHVGLLKQNASLEISKIENILEYGSISGELILPYFSQGKDGFEIHTYSDYMEAIRLVEEGIVTLPAIWKAQ